MGNALDVRQTGHREEGDASNSEPKSSKSEGERPGGCRTDRTDGRTDGRKDDDEIRKKRKSV